VNEMKLAPLDSLKKGRCLMLIVTSKKNAAVDRRGGPAPGRLGEPAGGRGAKWPGCGVSEIGWV
jgi:hypothetical protein